MAAVTNGDPTTTQALLAAGANTSAADAGGGIALTDASAAGAADAIQVLQKRGAKATGGDPYLAATGYMAAVKVLLAGGLSAGVDVNGSVPLLAAAGENCVETVSLLLDRGADVNAKDGDGWTALIKAASANMTDLARVLLTHGADMDMPRPTRSHGVDGRVDEDYEEMAALFAEFRAKKKK